MKKIPTLFERTFDNHNVVGITDKIYPGMEDALENGIATEKIDGSCCAIINGVFYKRYDVKKGRIPPANSIACGDPDPVTGHWPHWVLVDTVKPADKWYMEAFRNAWSSDPVGARELHTLSQLGPITLEAIGPHFQSNPYNLEKDILEQHGIRVLEGVPRTFEGIRDYLMAHNIEGIVFWQWDEPKCKIKRSDFGFEWPVIKREE